MHSCRLCIQSLWQLCVPNWCTVHTKHIVYIIESSMCPPWTSQVLDCSLFAILVFCDCPHLCYKAVLRPTAWWSWCDMLCYMIRSILSILLSCPFGVCRVEATNGYSLQPATCNHPYISTFLLYATHTLNMPQNGSHHLSCSSFRTSSSCFCRSSLTPLRPAIKGSPNNRSCLSHSYTLLLVASEAFPFSKPFTLFRATPVVTGSSIPLGTWSQPNAAMSCWSRWALKRSCASSSRERTRKFRCL